MNRQPATATSIMSEIGPLDVYTLPGTNDDNIRRSKSTQYYIWGSSALRPSHVNILREMN